jgi:glycosyltransferase involved in cell wall biosynthesis
MITHPLVSIITVTYNSEKTVKRTIASVLDQTYDNLEYIIIDGASKDDTVAVCNDALNNSGIAFTVISEPDEGIYDAMNKGIKLAKGEIVGIINSDDWYEPDAVEIIVNEILKKGSGVYYGIQRKIKDGREYYLERLHHSFLNLSMIPHSATFLTMDIYKKYGLFDLKYKFVADYDLMLRLSKLNIVFVPVNAILSNFTIGGASASYKAAIESVGLKYEHGILTKRGHLYKKIRILITDKYLRF